MILTLFTDNLRKTNNILKIWVEGSEPTATNNIKVYFSESAGVIANSVNQTGTIDATKIPVDTYNDLAIAIAKAHADGKIEAEEERAILDATTKANAARDEAKQHADDAVDSIRDIIQAASDDASTALGYLDDWASDGILSQVEKKSLRPGMEVRFVEYLDVKAQAATLGITTTALQNALDAWGTYLNGGASWNPPTSTPITNAMMPAWIKDANLSTAQAINRATFNSVATAYFDSLIDIKTAIATKLNNNIAGAGTTANWSNVYDTTGRKPSDYADNTVTTINGGVVTTGLIRDVNSNLIIDFANAKFTVNSSDGLIVKSNGQLNFYDVDNVKRGTIYSQPGIFSLVGASTSTAAIGGGFVNIHASTGYIRIQSEKVLNLESEEGLIYTKGDILPGSDNKYHFGYSSRAWRTVCATAFYRNGTELDGFDDLYELSNIKPLKRKTGIEQNNVINPKINMPYIDPFSLPEALTNINEIKLQLKKDNGDLISDKEIEELLNDYDEAGWMLNIDLGLFSDLTSGAVRQLDRDFQLMTEIAMGRITALENQVNRLINNKTMEKA